MKNKNLWEYSNTVFSHFTKWVSLIIGHPLSFLLALALIIIWACLGIVFNFSDTWQLVVNTLTTIITFLIVFLIQNTQNRDVESVLIKLDELIRSNKSANNEIIDLDSLSNEQLKKLEKEYIKLSQEKNNNES